MLRNIGALIALYLPVLCVQSYGALITATSVKDWYPTLEKSVLTPPGFVFGIVWTILYLMMTIAAWRVWRVERRFNTPALRLWLMQLIAGLVWTVIFFGMRLSHEGLAMIACVWFLIVMTWQAFRRIDKLAAALLVPLWLWVSFATYLQLVISLKN